MKEIEIIEDCGNGMFLVKLLKEYYEKEAVFAATASFRDNFFIKIDSFDDYVGVYFLSKNENNVAQKALLSFCNEAIEEQTKLDLNKRFGKLREIIYKHAFEPIS